MIRTIKEKHSQKRKKEKNAKKRTTSIDDYEESEWVRRETEKEKRYIERIVKNRKRKGGEPFSLVTRGA